MTFILIFIGMLMGLIFLSGQKASADDKLLKEIFDSKYTTTYARAVDPRDYNYIGSILFPDKTTPELSYEYIVGANRLPVIANIHAWGSEAEQESREGFTKKSGQIPGIKRKIPLDEEFLLRLRRQGLGDMDAVRNQIFGDIDKMIAACYARHEKSKIDAISTGQIVIADEKIQAIIDYGVPAEHQEALGGQDLWSDHVNSNPLEDIQTWKRTVKSNTGVDLVRAVTSETAVYNLLQNQNVRQALFGDNHQNTLVTLAQVNAYLQSRGLPTIAAYDARYRVQNEDGSYTTNRFLAENKFILLPSGALGEGLVGPTPDALLDGNLETLAREGIYAKVYKTGEDPVGIMTKAALTAIPTFPRAEEIFIATVLA